MLRSPLLHFLLAGALILALQRLGSVWLDARETPVVEVLRSEIEQQIDAYQRQMRRPATPEESLSIENRVIDDALWLEQSFALGLPEVDPVVRQRLVLNMRFLEGSEDLAEDELVERAIALGMDRSDTVVRRRLIDRVQALIRAGVRSTPPDETVLRDHYLATQARWREPTLLDFTHVFFSRDKRGAARTRDARDLLRQLVQGGISPDEAVARGDSLLTGHRFQAATPNRIVARLGPDFAASVEDAPVGRWIGPIESAFGTHLVWIEERVEARVPPFEEVRNRVLEDWIDEESRRALRRQLDRRREIVEIRVIDDREPAPAVEDGAGGA